MRLPVWFCVGFSLCVAMAPAAAQWKWKDARGQVVISDVPPPRDIPERDVLQRPEVVNRRAAAAPAAAPTSATAEAAAPKARVDPELEARRKKGEAEQQEKMKAEEQKVAQARAENCKRARAHLSSLESGMRLARTNENGEREILDDKGRADEMQRTRQIISSDCR
jgi:uncharacterized protein DUF4124